MPADYSDDSTTSSMPTVKASEKFGGDDNKSLESLVRQGDESVMDKYGSKAGVGSSSSSSAGKEANNTDDHGNILLYYIYH